jgi:hypothetical protein
MIKMYTAYTEEIDEPEAAAAEIVERLSLDGKLLKNSIGILHCYKEFAESGVVRAICDALPFDVVGMTSSSVSTEGLIAVFGLTISVLTSDDATFHAGVSAPCAGGADAPLTELYNRLVAPLPEKPKLLLMYAPLMPTIGGDEFTDKINELAGGIPVFGALSSSDDIDFSNCFTIYNGVSEATAVALVALCGNVEPELLSISILEENMLKYRAVVTESEKNILKSINDIPAEDYLVSIGLIDRGGMASMLSTPLIAETEDGSTLSRTCICGGEGAVVLCGHIPAGSKLGFAIIEPGDVVSTAAKKTEEALAIARRRENRGILLYSCVVRNWSLGVNNTEEQRKINEILSGKVPFSFAYCGGEIFPRKLDGGGYKALLQNVTLVICVL